MKRPTPKQLMKRYRKYRGLVYSISAAFAVAWGVEVAEPMSLALVLFCDSCWRWDGRVPFRKYLAQRLRWGLNDEGRQRKLRAKLLTRVPLLDYPQAERESQFDLKEFLASMSEDARIAVRLALSTGGDTGGSLKLPRTGGYRGRYRGVQGARTGGYRGHPSREYLEEVLRAKRGWTRARSRKAFKEIQEALP
jgi:hypothetical protein